MLRIRTHGTTTLDRAILDARTTDHVETYGAFPGKINFRAMAFVIMVALSFAYLFSVLAGYTSNLDEAARMCAEVLSNPGTDAIPAACR